MKFMVLHNGPRDDRHKVIINPLSVAYASNRIEDVYNSIVFAAGTAFPVIETVDEIEKMLNDCLKEARNEEAHRD